MSFPLVISFYSESTAYEKEAKSLINSCEKFNLDYLVQPIPSFGSWELNCCFKPSFILHVMQKVKKPIFWTDADSIFVKKPVKFPLQCDFAVRINTDLKDSNPSKVISNSIYIDYNQKTIELVKDWDLECKKALFERKEFEVWDQVCLQKVLFANKQNLKYLPMPKGFCKIADFKKDIVDKNDLYILHYQASRLYKKWINQEFREFDEIKSLNEHQLKKIRGF
jgi:hypothetical protein